jgi:negative regulator of flagellin synthesis FlgM
MKITPFRTNAVNTYANQAKKTVQNQPATPAGDKVELSPQALEANKYRAELKNLPAMRGEKVQQLKEQINNGTYRPSAAQIAAGIIKERHLDKLI